MGGWSVLRRSHRVLLDYSPTPRVDTWSVFLNKACQLSLFFLKLIN